MSTSLPPPPRYDVAYGNSLLPTAVNITQSPPNPNTSSSSVVIVILILASSVIVSIAIFLLLRFLSNRFRHPTSTSDQNSDNLKSHVSSDSLPLFTFGSVTGNLAAAGDCAVCLSKFEHHDQLRLLPLCCHAFHATCIDTWLASNSTCPLCRSTVHPSAATTNRGLNSGSFRIEIGSISRRRGGAAAAPPELPLPRSYSIGSFEYVVDNTGYEVSLDSAAYIDKELSLEMLAAAAAPPPPAVEVSGRRNWLREYVDSLTSVSVNSRTMLFRNSGRFFSASNSRNEAAAAGSGVVTEDLEANRAYGEEISEIFRWFSGV